MMKGRRGFTLVELLGVIVIIGLVVGGGIFGITKLIGQSKDKGSGVSVSSIEDAGNVYATEKNNDNDYWIEMTRTDIKGLVVGKYFCTTVGELQNKGLLEKDIDFSSLPDNIDKNTYVGIVKDNVTLVNSNAVLLNDVEKCDFKNNTCSTASIIYSVCTGTIINEEITEEIDVEKGDSYTDELTNIKFTDIKGENIEIDRSECSYKKNGDNVALYSSDNTKIDKNICNIGGLDQGTGYDIRVCTYTKGGSSSCKEINMSTKKINKPAYSNSGIEISILYDRAYIKGDADYYFKSSMDGTSSLLVNKCDDNRENCSDNSTMEIEKDKWYR